MLPGPAGRIGRHAPTWSRIRRFSAESTPLAQSQPGEKGTMHTHSHTKTQDRDQDQTQLDPFGHCDAHQLPPTLSHPRSPAHWSTGPPTVPRIHASRYPRRSSYPPAFSQIPTTDCRPGDLFRVHAQSQQAQVPHTLFLAPTNAISVVVTTCSSSAPRPRLEIWQHELACSAWVSFKSAGLQVCKMAGEQPSWQQ
ncbi:hypothetical protein BGZ61DRAFT_511569 [Ilyonectria robusta]|uniref:uncharacterized protein n=1 Tax=Ilyonectria robusta TaxID=1079257 RepID=UPI001E8D358B|nr:uncharacterized protein BGZ61DRAFT_511569 [Ilyonectria robusta]KAH8736851.1 hypothetical protein BGZ61DRAFT_511569 [Ilyonectria robusta]